MAAAAAGAVVVAAAAVHSVRTRASTTYRVTKPGQRTLRQGGQVSTVEAHNATVLVQSLQRLGRTGAKAVLVVHGRAQPHERGDLCARTAVTTKRA